MSTVLCSYCAVISSPHNFTSESNCSFAVRLAGKIPSNSRTLSNCTANRSALAKHNEKHFIRVGPPLRDSSSSETQVENPREHLCPAISPSLLSARTLVHFGRGSVAVRVCTRYRLAPRSHCRVRTHSLFLSSFSFLFGFSKKTLISGRFARVATGVTTTIDSRVTHLTL